MEAVAFSSRIGSTVVTLIDPFTSEIAGNPLQSRLSIKEPIPAMKKSVWRAVIEVGFIIFLFYSNLLMGEFERSGMGLKRGVMWAIEDVFTSANFEIATIAAFVGYVLFEFLRKQF